MLAHLRIKGDQVVNNSVIPFNLIKREWKSNIGTLTLDGDLILGVNDIDNTTIEIILSLNDESKRKYFNPSGERISFSIQ